MHVILGTVELPLLNSGIRFRAYPWQAERCTSLAHLDQVGSTSEFLQPHSTHSNRTGIAVFPRI